MIWSRAPRVLFLPRTWAHLTGKTDRPTIGVERLEYVSCRGRGSADIMSSALHGAFVVRLHLENRVIVLEPATFAWLLIGSVNSWVFAPLMMNSVGKTAGEMVESISVKRRLDVHGRQLRLHSRHALLLYRAHDDPSLTRTADVSTGASCSIRATRSSPSASSGCASTT